ncbi:AMP-binding protein [Streptomyces sp. ASQP_92]|uniref:AMP-binding protein n=1 Tax=Streptomyces sp. ASQP_92 TaxID=2979116 RepID=UPI0021BE1472|nr:AMP-binding protein [Streptomyces sp. ASQP_92]MCT9092444.1 AMP-binding protein [Streptomyces sp. ASQP_92]
MTPLLKGCTPWPEEFVDRYWAAGHWRGNTLDNLLRDWALEYGPRTALVHGDTRITYAHLNRSVNRMAAAFRMRGLRPGQRVVVQLPNVPERVITVFALMRAGAVPVLCPLSYREPHVPGIVRITQAIGYVAPPTHQGFDHTAMAGRTAAQWPFLRRVFTLDEPGTSSPYGGLTTDPSGCQYSPLGSLDSPPGPALALSADQVALFLLSTGAAEAPRLIPRTHNDYAYQARAAAESVALTANDVYLAALPPDSPVAFAGPGVVGALATGATVVLVEDPEPATCLAVIARERVTVAAVEASDAGAWLDVLPAFQADLSSLRSVHLIGADPLPEAAGRLGAELGCRLQRILAMPEGLLLLTRPDDPEKAVLSTLGRPLSPDDEIRIVDAEGKEVPDGEPGELLVRGPYTVRGYYRAPEENARSFTADGRFRTGLLASRNPDGTLALFGRAADFSIVPQGPADR